MPSARLLASAFSLVALAVASVPAAAADDLPVPDVSFSLCNTYTSQWDSDRDGSAETWTFCTTPQCGCMCPAVGTLIQIATPDQQRNFLVVASCQSGYGTSTEAGNGYPGVTVTPIVYLP
jgi:hypothetical protein